MVTYSIRGDGPAAFVVVVTGAGQATGYSAMTFATHERDCEWIAIRVELDKNRPVKLAD
jgi:hypothetical protein